MAEPEQEPLQPGGGGDDQKTNQHVRFDPKGHQHQQQQAQYLAEKPNIATSAVDQHTYYINIPIHPLSGQVDPNLDLLSLHPCMHVVFLGTCASWSSRTTSSLCEMSESSQCILFRNSS
jgi:hypothetical protein